MRAYVLINVRPGKVRGVVEAVSQMEGVRHADACWGLPDVFAVQLARLIWARPGHYTPDAADYFLFFAGNWITFCVLFYAMVAIWYLGGVLVRRLKKNPK